MRTASRLKARRSRSAGWSITPTPAEDFRRVPRKDKPQPVEVQLSEFCGAGEVAGNLGAIDHFLNDWLSVNPKK